MKSFFLSIFSAILITTTGYTQNDSLFIGLSGNAYITAGQEGAHISNQGLTNWTKSTAVASIYFYIQEKNTATLTLSAKGHSTIKVSCLGKTYQVKLASDDFMLVTVGKINIATSGYVKLDIQGISKSGDTFGEINSLIVSNVHGKTVYVKDFADYWGRRGPSVHLAYHMPQEKTEWFYNELTVPKAGETMYSYYMAAGFGEGYFGMQYNSPVERRVLFSVWSPFDTQDPKQIPEDARIKMLRRGEGVHIGEFGNEGSGGQSYLKYNWKAGNTYKFLMHIRPDGTGNTVYTAYFFATDEDKWHLIASFQRPKTNTWYTNAHSFLENFSPEQGYLSRQASYTNQWALGQDGVWRPLTKATFTHDATASAGVRLDYQGGAEKGDSFYLKMGGFFDASTKMGTTFERKPVGTQPIIDFEALEKL